MCVELLTFKPHSIPQIWLFLFHKYLLSSLFEFLVLFPPPPRKLHWWKLKITKTYMLYVCKSSHGWNSHLWSISFLCSHLLSILTEILFQGLNYNFDSPPCFCVPVPSMAPEISMGGKDRINLKWLSNHWI